MSSHVLQASARRAGHARRISIAISFARTLRGLDFQDLKLLPEFWMLDPSPPDPLIS